MTGAAILEKLGPRLRLWENTGMDALNRGVLESPEPPGGELHNLRWDYLDGKDHCSDCSALDGVVLSKAEWKALGIRPQSRDLECTGFNCGCRLTPTNQKSNNNGTLITEEGDE